MDEETFKKEMAEALRDPRGYLARKDRERRERQAQIAVKAWEQRRALERGLGVQTAEKSPELLARCEEAAKATRNRIEQAKKGGTR